MAGDVVSISTKGWYKDGAGTPVSGLTDIIHDQLLPLLTDGMVANNALQHGAISWPDVNSGNC